MNYFNHNSPSNRAREVFKPFEDTSFDLKKRFRFEFFVGYIIMGVGLSLFGPLYLALSPNHKREIFACFLKNAR